jgi:iron complex transport system substrate-binding protein
MKKRYLSILLILTMVTIMLTGCKGSNGGTETSGTQIQSEDSTTITETTGEVSESASAETSGEIVDSTTSAADSGDTYLFTDSAGRQVELPKNIERIAPSGSLAQIVLFAIAADKLVGLSDTWAEDASPYLDSKYLDLPVFGQFYGKGDLNMEALAAANPQVIIDIGEAKDTIVEDMDSIQKQLGIPTIFVEATLESMDDCYATIGKVLGLEAEGKTLSDYCNKVYTNTVDKMGTIKEEDKANLLYCVGDTGTSVIAKGSFHAEVLDLLANNVAVVDDPSSKGSGNEVSLEQIYLWNPDLILFAPGSVYDKVGTDKSWLELEAITKGSYYEVPNGPYNWMGFPPSVNRYIGMIWLSNLLYPDVFNYNLYDETAEYYKLFYHCDLTQEQYTALIAKSLVSKK